MPVLHTSNQSSATWRWSYISRPRLMVPAKTKQSLAQCCKWCLLFIRVWYTPEEKKERYILYILIIFYSSWGGILKGLEFQFPAGSIRSMNVSVVWSTKLEVNSREKRNIGHQVCQVVISYLFASSSILVANETNCKFSRTKHYMNIEWQICTQAKRHMGARELELESQKISIFITQAINLSNFHKYVK